MNLYTNVLLILGFIGTTLVGGTDSLIYKDGVKDTLLVFKHTRNWPVRKINIKEKKVSYYTILNKHTAFLDVNDFSNEDIVYHLALFFRSGHDDLFLANFNEKVHIIIPYGSSEDDLSMLKTKFFKTYGIRLGTAKFDQVLTVLPFNEFFKSRSSSFDIEKSEDAEEYSFQKPFTKDVKTNLLNINTYADLYKAISNHGSITLDNRLLLFKTLFRAGDYINDKFVINKIDKSTNSIIISGSKIKVFEE
jgi:hypothetical protein